MPDFSSDFSEAPTNAIHQLAALQGLGMKSAAALHSAGIGSVAELRKLGAVVAFLRVRQAGGRPSLNLLWALEGALTGVDWREVAKTERTRLLLALDDLCNAQRIPHDGG
ncbi:MAG: TfoX/Sxy family protein [Aquincola sp.]|uniref:TfoX/Sxy family protein n=1 Tax=uncultured Aquincola sp. TaxID=886556 RepID=UPI0032B18FE1|nr:TfoX/Sxy family protein [Aquincola sp.]|tara:strand:+ start:382 stop:711 length:330 start_codon:yes stop_codon:yes gene_type:complete